MAEMQAAKDNVGRIKITAGLYLISKNKSGVEAMKKVIYGFLNYVSNVANV